jgi:hypothetical protein
MSSFYNKVFLIIVLENYTIIIGYLIANTYQHKLYRLIKFLKTIISIQFIRKVRLEKTELT